MIIKRDDLKGKIPVELMYGTTRFKAKLMKHHMMEWRLDEIPEGGMEVFLYTSGEHLPGFASKVQFFGKNIKNFREYTKTLEDRHESEIEYYKILSESEETDDSEIEWGDPFDLNEE